MKWVGILLVLLFITGCGRNVMMDKITGTTEDQLKLKLAPATTMVSTFIEPDLLTVLIDPKDTDFVRVKEYIPDMIEDLRYSTDDNFTGQVIYDFKEAFLRYGTVMKLKAVNEELAVQGLGLKIWDGFRPVSAQFKLWEICPDSTYVADPNRGYSNHSRGFAVDVTLVDAQGRELEMPTGFDDFSGQADRDYSDCTQLQRDNAQLLESAMEKHGFAGYQGEWWHFNDTKQYEVETCFDPAIISRKCLKEETSLLETYWEPDSIILRIPSGADVTLLGYQEEYALVEYWGYRGYVHSEHLTK